MSPPPTFDDLEEDEIRVLYLEPGSFDEPLAGQLEKASIAQETIRRTEGTTASFQRQRRLSSESDNSNHSVTSTSIGAESPPRTLSSVQYEAVSYAWESLETPHLINIRKTGEIQITNSLFDLLRHFRYVHCHRRLWVDAVCIDQANVSERNQQVAKMADIFSTSSRVLVWLGAEASTDSLAFATIEVGRDLDISGSEDDGKSRDIPLALEMYHDALCEYTGPHASFRRNLEAQEDVAVQALRSIFNVFQAKWFERMWVVQETTLPHQLLFFRGYHAMTSFDLQEALSTLEEHQYSMKNRCRDIRVDRVALRNMIWHLKGGVSKLPDHAGEEIDRFLSYSDKHCQDPRDRVFALRGVLGLENFDELRPDYRLDHVEVFRRLICVFVNLGTTDLIHPALALALVGTELKPRSTTPNWPSWVPCLHELTDASRAKLNLYHKTWLSFNTPYASFGDRWLAYAELFSARVRPESPNLLQLRGRCFAKARETCSVQNVPELGPQFLYEDTTTKDQVETVADWFVAYCFAIADCIPGVLDMGLDENLAYFAFYPSKWTLLLFYGQDMKPLKEKGFTDLLNLLVARGTDGKVNLDFRSCYQVIDLALQLPGCPLASRRKLWQVQLEGRTDAAWLPADAQVGDSICVISGAPWPLVIRKFDENSYTLIGDAHIFHTSLIEALGTGQQSAQQEYTLWPGEPLGFNTDIQPSDLDMANLTWITLC